MRSNCPAFHQAKTFKDLELSWDKEAQKKANQQLWDIEKIDGVGRKIQVAGYDDAQALPASSSINNLLLRKAPLPSPRLCAFLRVFRRLNADAIKAIKPFIQRELAQRFPSSLLESIPENDGKYDNLRELVNEEFAAFDAPQLRQTGLGGCNFQLVNFSLRAVRSNLAMPG